MKSAGAIPVASSRWAGLQSRGRKRGGFRAPTVRKTIDAIARQPGKPLYKYDVIVRYRGRDGKMKKGGISGVGVPMLRSAAKRRRKGETTKQALKRLVLQEIERTVVGTVRGEWGRYELGDTTTKMGRERAKKILRNVKLREKATFKVEFYRVIKTKARRINRRSR